MSLVDQSTMNVSEQIIRFKGCEDNHLAATLHTPDPDMGQPPALFMHGGGQTRYSWDDAARRLAGIGWATWLPALMMVFGLATAGITGSGIGQQRRRRRETTSCPTITVSFMSLASHLTKSDRSFETSFGLPLKPYRESSSN